jgi:hypothetical protein
MSQESNQSFIMRLRPALGKRWLFLVAGLIRCVVGVRMNSYAAEWFALAKAGMFPWLFAAGLLVGLVFYGIILARFAEKNIRRIDAYSEDRICLFAFQRWSSYPLVAFMIGLGIFLRKYSPIPKPYLAPLYFGIGSALFVAGLKYFLRIGSRQRIGTPPKT